MPSWLNWLLKVRTSCSSRFILSAESSRFSTIFSSRRGSSGSIRLHHCGSWAIELASLVGLRLRGLSGGRSLPAEQAVESGRHKSAVAQGSLDALEALQHLVQPLHQNVALGLTRPPDPSAGRRSLVFREVA